MSNDFVSEVDSQFSDSDFDFSETGTATKKPNQQGNTVSEIDIKKLLCSKLKYNVNKYGRSSKNVKKSRTLISTCETDALDEEALVTYRDYANKPSCVVSRLPTVFLAKKLSKYRLKQPKYS